MHSFTIRKQFTIGAIIILALSLLSVFIHAPKANAAYEAGLIIDDSVFLDAKSMSIADIQNFLTARGSGLRNMTFTLQCYGSGSQERQWYTAAGARCDTPIPASEIIYYAAQIYGVSPKVILTTMQKEQSLTTAANPTSWQLNQAMGYACPTSGSCGGNSTFPYQIDSGTWALRFHFERARGNMNWWYTSSSWTYGTEKSLYKPSLYPGQNVRFYDTNGTHYTTVYIQNAATSTMYCYTPHAYNNPQGLYGRAPYGTTGLYYSGSYNFVYFYELWFGSVRSGFCQTNLTTSATNVLFGNRYGKVSNANFLIYSGASTGCVELHSWQIGFDFGTWREHISTNSSAISSADSQLSFADLDGDGKDELILVGLRNTGSGMIEFHVWNYDLKSWKEHIISNHPTINPGVSSVHFADTDGDGKDEGVLVGQGNGSTSTGKIEFHVWNGGFQTWKGHYISNSSTLDPQISAIRFADLDGDKKDEAILVGYGHGSTSTGKIEFHVWNYGFGSWRSHHASNSATINPAVSSVQFGDLDGNGRDEGILIGEKAPTGSGKIEFHVWSEGFGSWRTNSTSNQSAPTL